MPAKPRWSELELGLETPPPHSELGDDRVEPAAWGAWRALDSSASRTSSTRSVGGASDSPFVFSMDDVTLRSGLAVLESAPPPPMTTRRLPPPVRELDLVRMAMMSGSLRTGGPVRFLSAKYAGLAVCAVCYALTTAAVGAGVQWLRPRELGLGSFRRLERLLRLEWAVAFPVGLLSDAFAPLGYHRKSFMIAGWSVLAVVWAAQYVAYQFRASLFAAGAPPPAFASVAAVVGTLALAAVHIPLTVRVLELSQQEELSRRGRVVAMYLVLTLLPQLAVRTSVLLQSVLTTTPAEASTGERDGVLAEDDRLELVVSLPLASAGLVLVALTPIPFLVLFAHEPQSSASTSRSIMAMLRWRKAPKRVGDAARRLWSAVHCKAVSDVVMANAVLFFFAQLAYPGADRAVSAWCGETLEFVLLRAVVLDAATIVAVLLWMRLLVDASWVAGILVVLPVWKLSALLATALVAFDVLRQPWVPSVAALWVAPTKAALWLAGMLPTVEVVQQGNEGAIYGLVVSYQLLAQLLGDQIVSGVQSTGALVHPGRRSDASAVSGPRVVIGAAVLTAVSLLSLLAVCLMPRQKLGAQQRRLLGGHSGARRLGLVVGLAVLYALVVGLQLAHNTPAGQLAC